MLLNIIYLLAGFIILVYGANLLVDGGAALAHRLKVPNIVIGLTVVAFGTSTPELVVNIISSIEGSSALALGNVLGSNIFNIMAILGVTALFVPIGIKRSTTWIEIPLAVLAAVLILILANGEPAGIITRAEGFCLLCFFAVFIAYTLFIAKRGGQETEEVNIKPYSLKKSVLFILLGLAGLVGGGRLLVDGAVSLAQIGRYFGTNHRIDHYLYRNLPAGISHFLDRCPQEKRRYSHRKCRGFEYLQYLPDPGSFGRHIPSEGNNG